MLTPSQPRPSWTWTLWADVEPIFDAVLRHPFLRGLSDGSLPADRFAYYVAQDSHYLRDFSRALAAVAVRAPTHDQTARFAEHAAATARVEMDLHRSLLPELGLDPQRLGQIPLSPTTAAYTNFLTSVACTGSYADGVAAVLPCFWVYHRVGEALVASGSPDPRYQRWIDQYSGEEFATAVQGVLDLADELRPGLSEGDAARAAGHFRTATRYEWMFWDAAWRMESWPV